MLLQNCPFVGQLILIRLKQTDQQVTLITVQEAAAIKPADSECRAGSRELSCSVAIRDIF